MKDKQVLAQLKERLKSAESTLQGIVAMEQLRVSRMVYGILLQQQSTMDKIERGEILCKDVINMAVINQPSPQSTPTVVQAQLSEIKPTTNQSSRVLTKPTQLLPRTARFDRWGFSAQLVTLPKDKDKGTSYRAAVHISLLGKMYSVQLQMSSRGFSFDRMLHVRNIVPTDSEMVVACRTGDFDRARGLLARGLAHGSDITASGWPMLDYAIKSGSTRLVRLLLEHGADPDMAYGEHNM
ncbi:hypothetical protein QBC46DRAFT_422103 [Diplogelasinospora grovesii]|uniref:Ankyrin repeat protein n=1 Tax=Diplogelasinospora grovesii TaxID=303347 RepID=A0AAN6MZF4_9PEZI|nr:hypothetical protein QBC46DRAFT_422103 [Diplogelasinospora grovesii]